MYVVNDSSLEMAKRAQAAVAWRVVLQKLLEHSLSIVWRMSVTDI